MKSRILMFIFIMSLLFHTSSSVWMIQAQSPSLEEPTPTLYMPLLLRGDLRIIAKNQFGYAMRDNHSDEELVFEWEEIETTGTEILTDVHNREIIDLGFYFPFYDGEYNSVAVHDYGILGFNTRSSAEVGTLKSFGAVHRVPGLTHIYYQHLTDPERVIIEYRDLVICCEDGTADFQTILYASGDISIHYLHLKYLDPKHQQIGVQNSAGHDPLEYNGQPPDRTIVKIDYPDEPNHTYPPDDKRWHSNLIPSTETPYSSIFLDQNELVPQTIFLGTTNGYLIRSNDRGDSWTATTPSSTWNGDANVGYTRDFAFNPTPDSKIVFAAGDSLVRSTNHGNSWALLNSTPNLRVYQIVYSPSYSSGNTVFMVGNGQGGYNGVWYSNDSGIVWQQLGDSGEIQFPRAIHFSSQFRDSKKMWLTARGSKLYHSNDAGATWQSFDLPTDQHVLHVLPQPNKVSDDLLLINRYGLYDFELLHSVDDGLNWDKISDLPWDAKDIFASSSYSDDQTLYLLRSAINSTALQRSTDGGKNWHPFSDGLPRGKVFALGEHIKTSTLFAVLKLSGTYDGVQLYRLDKNDTTWRLVSGATPYKLSTVQPGFAINQTNDLTVFAGHHQTNDEGKTWIDLSEALDGLQFKAVAASPQFAQDGKAWGVVGGKFLETSDSGNTWREVLPTGTNSLYGGERPLAVAPQFFTDSTVFVVLIDGVWRTQNAGASWENVAAVPGARSTVISPDYANDRTVFSDDGYSLDGGNAWVTKHLGGIRVSPSFAQDSAIYQVQRPDQRILLKRSIDYGESWQVTILPEQIQDRVVDLILSPCLINHPSMVIGTDIASTGVTWISDNGGTTWRWYGAGKLGEYSHRQSYFYVPEKQRLYHINDSGLWWAQLDWPSPGNCPE